MNLLALYSDLLARHQAGHRFLDEVFVSRVYDRAVPKFTVVDLGAYEGEFSFRCLPFSEKIYAIEPDPNPNFELVSLVESHNLSDKIKVFDLAIGGGNGQRKMTFSGGGGNSFSEGTGPVKTLTLNTFFNENSIEHVDILKIDVEGAEYEIFEAVDFKEAAPKIDLIIGEAHDGNLDILENYGFEFVSGLEGNVFMAQK